MTGESGHYVIDSNDDDTAVVLSFSHLGEDGVETFETAMPPAAALTFGQAVVDWATEMLTDGE